MESNAEASRRIGDDATRQEVLKVHQGYVAASIACDADLLAQVWDPDPSDVHFALSGHTYQGLSHLQQIYGYYRPQLEIDVPCEAFDEDVEVADDVAWVTCSRFGSTRWVGQTPPPLADGPQLYRSTEIMVRGAGGWQVVHSHFSPISQEPRPGDI
jgi:ketosteroid isomerase-like protein